MTEFWNKVVKTLRHFEHESLIFARGLWWDVMRPMPRAPVFIVGCSRAGTTLVYKTFSESGDLGSLQKETHDFWSGLHPLEEHHWESHALSEKDARESDRISVARYFFSHTGKRRFVDKNNQNGLSIPYLHALFPDAYFVYVMRSPGDNLNSLIEGWRRPDEYATWSRDLPSKVCVDGRVVTAAGELLGEFADCRSGTGMMAFTGGRAEGMMSNDIYRGAVNIGDFLSTWAAGQLPAPIKAK